MCGSGTGCGSNQPVGLAKIVSNMTSSSTRGGLGLLFACLPQALRASYSQDPYPNNPINPGIVPQLDPVWTPTQVSNYKAQ